MEKVIILLKEIDKQIVVFTNKLNGDEEFDLAPFQQEIEKFCQYIQEMDQETAKTYLPDLHRIISITTKWQRILTERQRNIVAKIEVVNRSRNVIETYNNINLNLVTNDNE
jgi:hypothetical protein